MSDESRTERAFTELFHRLPLEPLPFGFRDTVMARIATSSVRSRRREWIAAAAIALPNLAFLLWAALASGPELVAALGGVANVLLGLEEWDASAAVYVDGLLVLSVALVGLAALLVAHALLGQDRARPRRTLAA